MEEGGFDRAARKLHLTQSAISQRIRNLEEQVGQVLVVRSVPPEPTEAGRRMIRHLRQVRLMEHELEESLGIGDPGDFVTLPVGVNADSLATWFIDALEDFMHENRVLLDIYVDDENRTYEMLKNGEVAGCIGTDKGKVKSCRSQFLAAVDYLCVCTPGFLARWFKNGFNHESVSRAPAAVFNRSDETQSMMLRKIFPGRELSHPIFYVPSSESFVDVVSRGLVYGMVPEMQAESGIRSGRLVEIMPEARVPVNLYWHSWNIDNPLLSQLSRTLSEYFDSTFRK